MSNRKNVTTSPPAKDPVLDEAIQNHLGCQLRALYGEPADDMLPLKLKRLGDRVAQVIRAHTEPMDQAFADGIMNRLSSLRSFAISLTKDTSRAEDLVQETVLKAIARQESFEAGTNIQAWLFTILRNQFYTSRRKTQSRLRMRMVPLPRP